MGALCHLVLQYIDWLANQLLPDTAEHEWLDRHGQIWLVNADGSIGRKMASYANGSVSVTGVQGTVLPQFSQFSYVGNNASYETLEQVTVSASPTPVMTRALIPGTAGNLDPGTAMALLAAVPGVDTTATVLTMNNGTDVETDEELRGRILLRIRQPPMGGDADDYVEWALSYPGVTRAWCYPLEMGIGTVTVRFMMDDLRADNNGFPFPEDVLNVSNYLNTVRPVAVKDFFCEAPIPFPVNIHITWLNPDDVPTRNAITASLVAQFLLLSAPGQTWYRAWTDQAVMNTVSVIAYDLDPSTVDAVMSSAGYMPIVGDITYA